MDFSIAFAEEQCTYEPRIKVVGVGGSGGNAVTTMMSTGLEGVEFVAINTDAQALGRCPAPVKLQIGSTVTRGLGAGADPERGRKAALEDATRVQELLSGADMVFVTAGMGGGTGTGAAPVVAQLAREEGCLCVGVVTKPFQFEGKHRSRLAVEGLVLLSEQVDSLVTIPNDKLVALEDQDLSLLDAFRRANEVLYQAVKGISDLITHPGIVNVDFADVRTVMSHRGRALMGTGYAKGEGRARLALELAISSPLLDDIAVDGAMGVLMNFVGGPDMRVREVHEAATVIREQADEDANIIWGASVDESMGDAIKVTVIATGFDAAPRGQAIEPAAVAAERPVLRAQRAALGPPPAAAAGRSGGEPSPVPASSVRRAPPPLRRPRRRQRVLRPIAWRHSPRPIRRPLPRSSSASSRYPLFS
ncbi:MAG: cell division protein FtsZ, partial [Deltaproteobacteria bacterium]|nr:cell division protein FtsZ [Deltaproteobacteria bacterium]